MVTFYNSEIDIVSYCLPCTINLCAWSLEKYKLRFEYFRVVAVYWQQLGKSEVDYIVLSNGKVQLHTNSHSVLMKKSECFWK